MAVFYWNAACAVLVLKVLNKLASLLSEMLAKADPNWDKNPDIKWNFTKFWVNRNGVVVERFEPTADMKEVEAKIIKLL